MIDTLDHTIPVPDCRKREPISRAFNVAVLQMASRVCQAGFDILPEAEAPGTLAELNAYIARTGRIAVSSAYSDRTQFSDPDVNAAFRAWHDWTHWRIQAEFTPLGEGLAAERQIADLRAIYGHNREFEALVRIEVVGQLVYAETHGGQFPADQWAFTLQQLNRYRDNWRVSDRALVQEIATPARGWTP